MESLELLNDQYGHCGECHEVHYIPDMVAIDGYYYCKSCSRPTPLALDGAFAACPHRAVVNHPAVGVVVECEYQPRQ